jgi:drug/metabolite transporter (DMT)-like permease
LFSDLLRRLDWRVGVALAATYLLFGSGPAAAAAALKSFPPFLMVASRGLIAGLSLTLWAFLEGARPTWSEWRASLLVGFLILACGAGAGTYGQLTVASGVAGVLSALLPLFAAIMGYCVFGEKLPFRGTVGLVIGFAGIALLLRPGSGLDLFGVVVIVGGQIAWAAGAELSPRVGLPEEPRLAAGLELLSGGVSWIGFLWCIVIAIGGSTAFGYLSQTVAPSVATTFSYVNPVVAMTLGWLIFSEPITWRMVIAVAVIVTGVCLIVSSKSDAPAKTRHPMTSGHGKRRTALHAVTRPVAGD